MLLLAGLLTEGRVRATSHSNPTPRPIICGRLPRGRLESWWVACGVDQTNEEGWRGGWCMHLCAYGRVRMAFDVDRWIDWVALTGSPQPQPHRTTEQPHAALRERHRGVRAAQHYGAGGLREGRRAGKQSMQRALFIHVDRTQHDCDKCINEWTARRAGRCIYTMWTHRLPRDTLHA